MKLKEEKTFKGQVDLNYLGKNIKGNASFKKQSSKISSWEVQEQIYARHEINNSPITLNRLDIGGRYGNALSITEETTWDLELLNRVIERNFTGVNFSKPKIISTVFNNFIRNGFTQARKSLTHEWWESEDAKIIEAARLDLSKVLPTKEGDLFEIYIPTETFHPNFIFRSFYLLTLYPDLLRDEEIYILCKAILNISSKVEAELFNSHTSSKRTLRKPLRRVLIKSTEIRKELVKDLINTKLNKEDLISSAEKFCKPITKKITALREKLKDKKTLERFRSRPTYEVLANEDNLSTKLYTEYRWILSCKEELITESIEKLEFLKTISNYLGSLSED